jgi:thiamine transport system substrate-binding protein
VCINYDKAWFASRHLAVPKTLEDLTKPAYRGQLVTENAATSSPGLAFVLATIARYGASGWTRYWQRLRANGVKVVDGWEEAYDGDFSAASGHGSYPLVVSYASSPPAEVVYANPTPKYAPTGVMTDTCFRQVEFAGVLRGAAHPKAAQQLIDFMLTRRFQADVPLQMYVFPARSGTPLPTVFTKYAAMPAKPLTLSAKTIGAHRDAWIQQWTDTVLR